MFFFQQEPIVVDVIKQPPPAKDISIDVILGMFQMAGVVLLAAAVGGLIVGADLHRHPPPSRRIRAVLRFRSRQTAYLTQTEVTTEIADVYGFTRMASSRLLASRSERR